MLRVLMQDTAQVPQSHLTAVVTMLQEMALEPFTSTVDGGILSPKRGRSIMEQRVDSADIMLVLTDDYLPENLIHALQRAKVRGIPVLVAVRRMRDLEEIRNDIEATSTGNAIVFSYDDNINQLVGLLRRQMGELIASRVRQAPRITQDREEHYAVATDIIKIARHKLLMIERTPVLLLGPGPFYYEEEFHQVLTEWCEHVASETRECRLLFCLPDTAAEIKLEHKEQIFRDRLRYYKELERQTKGRFLLSSLSQYYGSFIVGDHSCAIWFKGRDKAISLEYRDHPPLAEVMICVHNRLLGDRIASEQEILRDLGL